MSEGSGRPRTGHKILEEIPHGLHARLLELGTSKDWETARKEWRIANVRHEKGGVICLCGRAVHWIHEIRNSHTGKVALLGGACAQMTLVNGEADMLRRLHQLNDVHARPDGEISDRSGVPGIRHACAVRTNGIL